MRTLSLRSLFSSRLCLRSSSRTSSSFMSTSSSSQLSNPAPLLLEGDKFCVSKFGLSRSFYQQVFPPCPVSIEERYNLAKAQKTFLIRRTVSSYEEDNDESNVVSMGPCLTSVDLQEIDKGVFDSTIGTGGTTWEASFAMAMFFTTNSYLLRGHVLELGSGCGLGGILTNLGPHLLGKATSYDSMTFTDGNEEVLAQCRTNVESVLGFHRGLTVKVLDWDQPNHQDRERYDTVIACDCAYSYPAIPSLCQTMKSMLCDDPLASIHMFGPYNRGAIIDAIHYLSETLQMNVQMESLEMTRYRLQATDSGRHDSHVGDSYVSKSTAKFLHVMASRKRIDKEKVEASLQDLD